VTIVHVSAFMFLTDRTIGPAELGHALEERTIHALWVPEHPHIPVKRATPVPAAYGGGELAPMYLRLLDPFVALTAVAAATNALRVGTGICLIALRDPVVTAKEIATLDYLSGGRFEFGVGYGWNEDEFEDHGQRFAERHAVVRDKVALMRRLWDDDVAEYHGQHADVQPTWAWPKPVRQGSPRVWLGGNGRSTMQEAARWADRWFPTPTSNLESQIAQFREMVVEAGRESEDVAVGVAATPADAEFIANCVAWGVDEISVALPSAGRDEVLTFLDDLVSTRDLVLA
jgi:probable F420-dependent oxidoreductase